MLASSGHARTPWFFAAMAGTAVLGCAGRQSVADAASWMMPHVARSDGGPDRMSNPPPLAVWGAGDEPPGASELAPDERPEPLALSPLWRDDEQAARAEATQRGRGLVVVLGATWCLECRRLDASVLADPAVLGEIARGFVGLRLDVTEPSARVRVVLERYRARRLPTLVVFAPDGREIDRLEEPSTVDDLVARLRAARAAPSSPAPPS